MHGVLPRALIERASERTPAPSANGAGTPASGLVSSQAVKSKEGLGQDLLQDNVDGRLTMEVTGSMHSVSVASSVLRELADAEAKDEDGPAQHGRLRRLAGRVWDLRGDDGDDHLEPGMSRCARGLADC